MRFSVDFVLFLILCILSSSVSDFQNEYDSNDIKIEKLPYCGDTFELSEQRRLLLVSTLDGKLSALNVDDNGSELWNVQTGPGAMLSSSIHRLELTNNGQWVRMIPSLSGGLYKFNGEYIEPIPVTADNLLLSSFRYSDDLVISGGKESRTYGMDRETGQLLYECLMSGCENYTTLEAAGDIVLIQRLTQTVRAVEPRTGLERWNFSVAQHNVKLETGPRSGCYTYSSQSHSDLQLKVIVPEGLVCAISKTQPGRVLWSHKFDAPVVNAWNLAQGQVEDVDLFSGTQPPPGHGDDPLPSSPALYVGMHQKQLYIQESVSMQQKLDLLTGPFSHHLLAGERHYLQIPWQPVPVTSTAVGLPSLESNQLTTDFSYEDTHENNQTTALSVLYASEYVNGNGYVLYIKPEPKKNSTICIANDTEHNDTAEEDVPVVESPDDIVVVPQIFVTSLWFWWKEVFLISVTTAVVVNIIIQRRLGHSSQFPTSQIVLMKDTLRQYSSRDSITPSDSSSRSSESFESRFLTDFMPVHCLGKGGFGVVFEAKNKIDDCHYAVKRIPLPNSEESRERVMREVKALAKLDHQNIVRYFNAWMECPPPGWQETQDQLWKVSRDLASSNGGAFTVDLTGQVTPDSERSVGHVINRNRLKPQSLWTTPDWLSQSEALPPKGHTNVDDDDDDDDNDSFIVFGSPSKEVSTAVSESSGSIEEIEEKDDEMLESAIVIPTDTSYTDTNTNVTDVEKSNSPKRPTKLNLNIECTQKHFLTSSRMFLFIQMQLCMKKSLKDWLRDNTHNRCRSEVLNIFEQIVRAVEYVHMQGLIHRDLKPSNIFFSPDMQVKVGDFGLVTAMAESPVEMWVSVGEELDGMGDGSHTARVGTQLYMSPEQVSGKPYSYKVDIYSLGVILFELLVPFNTQMERVHTLTNLRANKFPADFQTKFAEEYELLKLMLSHRPEERPTTIGIQSRPPLNCDSAGSPTSEWQFELPSRRRLSTSFSKNSSHSSNLES